MEQFSQQIDAYIAWKRKLVQEISHYRNWLEGCRLNSPEINRRIDRALRLLHVDHITLAFVGEYSRGKTELINSLFFSGYGQRMLPSYAGRTTMCPTEVFYDPTAEQPYMRLLPIQTRAASASVAQFKRILRHWVYIPLDSSDPVGMARAFTQLAKTTELTVDKAIRLGFSAEMLEAAETPGYVRVPAWRHALVSADHPLLRQGLRVLDTPGLNALGSEPELALSMLPAAQSILFLLAADCGVTASDMTIWRSHIRHLSEEHQVTLYAVLNKIDTLWGDLAGEKFVDASIHQIRDITARQLGLSTEAVLPLSAKQALLAKIRGDNTLLQRSQLENLESLLCDCIVTQKAHLLENSALSQVLGLLNNSQRSLRLRLEKAKEQQELLNSQQDGKAELLQELTLKIQEEHRLYHRCLINLKTSQPQLRQQAEALGKALPAERLEQHMHQVRQGLRSSWTTLGINQAILQFFRSLRDDLLRLSQPVYETNQLVAALYQQHNLEHPQSPLEAPQFHLEHYLNELTRLQGTADRFRRNLITLLTQQQVVARRFFTTVAQGVIGLHQRLHEDAENWAGDALLPIMQQSLEHKQLLELHMLRLKSLAQETQDVQQQALVLGRYLEGLDRQLTEASSILQQLRKPSPLQRTALRSSKQQPA